MEWYPVSSLAHSASMKIVTEIFRSPAVLQTILSLHDDLLYVPDRVEDKKRPPDRTPRLDRSEYRNRMIPVVRPLVESLKLPPKLERKLMSFCEPVSLQLAWWARRLTETLTEAECDGGGDGMHRPKMEDVLALARWKWDGRLDVEGSTEKLVRRAKKKKWRSRKRFEQACFYFLEREPFRQWRTEQMLVHAFENRAPFDTSLPMLDWLPHYARDIHHYDVSYFWRNGIRECTTACNEPGVKRCWRRWLAAWQPRRHKKPARPIYFEDYDFLGRFIKLSDDKLRDWCVVRYPCPPQVEILRFLYSQLYKEHLKELVNNEHVLGMFLEWPYQSLVLNLLRATWDVLTERRFCLFLNTALRNVSPQRDEGAELVDYRQLSKDIWTESPPKFKSSFLERRGGLFDLLYDARVNWMDIRETLAFFYKDFSIAEKRLFLDRNWEWLCQKLLVRNGRTKLQTFMDDFGGADDDGCRREVKIVRPSVDVYGEDWVEVIPLFWRIKDPECS